MRIFVVAILALALGSTAYSKVRLNSMCYVLDHAGAKMEGERTNELFEWASVSKLATAYWSLREMGPTYQFRTRIHITRISQDQFDVHIEGGRDPFWGRELTHFLFAELNRFKITNIRQLTFDENLIFRWHVVTDFVDPFSPTADEIVKAIRTHIQNLPREYPQTRREAAAVGVQLPKALVLQVHSIASVTRANFHPEANTRTFAYRSAPLYRYLKEMNRVSNNHVADHIFDFLGGANKFKDFVAQDMQLDEHDIQFVNGSGNSIISTDATGAPLKVYNKGTCETIIKILIRMEGELKAHHMHLQDIMAVSRTDESTLTPRYDSIPNTLIGKTGTVDPAINLAGVISTSEGEVYFGVFAGTDGAADWGGARDLVRNKVFELLGQFGGAKPIKYASTPFLPFDRNSGLAPESPRLARVP